MSRARDYLWRRQQQAVYADILSERKDPVQGLDPLYLSSDRTPWWQEVGMTWLAPPRE